MRTSSLFVLTLSLLGCSLAIDAELAKKPTSVEGGVDASDDGGGDDAGPTTRPCGDVPCDCSSGHLCGEHACPSVGGGGACICVLGYVVGGSGCEWGGGLRDPELSDPSVWSASGGAHIDPDFELDGGELSDPGVAVFDHDAICAYGEVSQVVTMPSRALSEPFVLSVEWYARYVDYPEDPRPDLAVSIAGRLHRIPSGVSSTTARICLGRRAYDGDVEIKLGVVQRELCSEFVLQQTLLVDRVAIEAAAPDECPDFDEVLNGDLEAEGGWILSQAGNASAQIQNGIGTAGSRGLRLETTTYCSNAQAETTMLVPSTSDVVSPALQLSWSMTSGRQIIVRTHAAGAVIGRLTGTGMTRTSRICLPPWLHGTTSPLRFAVVASSGGCAVGDVQNATIDDIELVNEPACGTSPYLLDGGFELATNSAIPPVWNLSTMSSGIAEVIESPSDARTGNGVLRLALSQRCSEANAGNDVIVPPPQSGEGPALRFWYRTNGLSLLPGVNVVVGSSPTSFGSAPTWTEGFVCLPLSQVGRTQSVQFGIIISGSCAMTFPVEEIYLDDLVVGTHPDCPAE